MTTSWFDALTDAPFAVIQTRGKQGFAPDVLVTDKLRSYSAAKSEIGIVGSPQAGLRRRTIGLKGIRISHTTAESVRCSGSNRPDQPNASCPFTPRSTTLSTSSVIPLPAARFVS